ncbi:bifunctional 2-C-methyl-D-erythritol 4-phosphate cytidylyltransferase/2-C-methyl-D-erythritol 2,4-cyclodiphosphate synthase [Lichenifustis flavocetrariae]|uniref:Bifunctional enzyme IspD/IspF n=1 Tax=Lichenifustis flavocetrariae TaxID=2949735 RepID=A0AA42CJ84_9HYPH|nr:bifunctional 2-C-methyl-D-erythritol 4-phosphate cytidylyltransferase/2-C-methyl-D-erythritol 2,4-cyclodiphosphate synthase [Lichenifustis flavocetrariae]MCW6509318.1 bifunctional 2-C-methyl-D-erythritol 4-phosphate cytidylyltransferase/2-C-methyl-D-erythritol 2,4-cyclodiphosphate synthase [Lichenifustis flavocetrariae]
MAGSSHILVVAAGRGSRAGEGLPKQYRSVAGEPLLTRTLRAMLADPSVEGVTPVIHPDDEALFQQSASILNGAGSGRLGAPAHGGATRQQSVHAGLEALARRNGPKPDIVLIHDGARPFSSPALIKRAVRHARLHGAAVPGFLVTDTIKQVSSDGAVVGTPDRRALRAVQTPQAFAFDLILDAHRQASEAERHDLTDDAAVAEFAGHQVFVFEGEPENTKITTLDDFARAEARIQSSLLDVRVGQGYDVHAFAPGDHVWLGGIKVPHDRTLLGHSDADVLLHAITDAILGAIGDGDIGAHFPPSQPQWKGAASDIFLKDAMARVAALGGIVAHIDATLVCERPKIGPHRDAIRERIAAITGLSIGRVAVKATTSERLGFTGREEGIAALAIATVRLPV